MNMYQGAEFQQATSCVSVTGTPSFLEMVRVAHKMGGLAQDCYQLATECYAVYGFEYKPGRCIILTSHDDVY